MKTIQWSMLAISVFLLGINILGLTRSMRNPEVYAEDYTMRAKGVEMKLEDAKKELIRKENESDRDYAVRANEVVWKGTMHYWQRDGRKKYYMTVPLWENYLLSIRNRIRGYDRYEFRSWGKNLERGIGLCSTHSIILKGLLLDNGIEARLWDLTRHVVVEAKVSDNEWIVLDPNMGYHVPHSMEEIQANPELVRPVYENMAELYKTDPAFLYRDPYNTELMVEMFGYEESRIYSLDAGFENFSYTAIWVLPLLFLFGGASLFLLEKNKRNRTDNVIHPEEK